MYFKKIKNLTFALCALLVCLGFSSCGKDEEPKAKPEYTVTITPSSTDEVTFSGGAIDVTVEVKDKATGAAAAIGWAASSSESWVTLDPQRGNGAGKFKATIAEHSLEAARTATVTVKLADDQGEAAITVKQGGKEINWEWARKGKFSDSCVGVHSGWGDDWGDYTAALYKKCELGADGWLTLKTDSRLHYFLCEVEPGYTKFISVPDKQYASEPEVTPEKSPVQDCSINLNSSPKLLSPMEPADRNGGNEIYDHSKGKTPVEYKFHLKAGIYWIVCFRAGEGIEDDDSPYKGCGQYPVDVEVDELYKFVKD